MGLWSRVIFTVNAGMVPGFVVHGFMGLVVSWVSWLHWFHGFSGLWFHWFRGFTGFVVSLMSFMSFVVSWGSMVS